MHAASGRADMPSCLWDRTSAEVRTLNSKFAALVSDWDGTIDTNAAVAHAQRRRRRRLVPSCQPTVMGLERVRSTMESMILARIADRLQRLVLAPRRHIAPEHDGTVE